MDDTRDFGKRWFDDPDFQKWRASKGACASKAIEPQPIPTLPEIWKGHAEVWRAEEMQWSAKALEAQAQIPQYGVVTGEDLLERLCGNIAERYEAKAKESEG